MLRTHNSKNNNLEVENRTQNNRLKPAGLWYGIGSEWLDWCKSEMPGWVHPYNYVLELDIAKMLIITNLEEFDRFYEEYNFCPCDESSGIRYIDWKRVVLKYGGIEISPYLWERRLDINSMWYYGWDCASGCVWYKDIILSCEKQ